MKTKLIVAMVLFTMLFATLIPLGASVEGGRGVGILELTPDSSTGAAGTEGRLIGTVNTLDGRYQVLVGKTVVADAKANGYSVDANFTVPELPAATYSLTLSDISANINTSRQFTVITGYSVHAVPSTIQEGSNLTINVAVTGSRLGTSYGANIVVSAPGGRSYTAVVNLGTPNVKGTASK